MWLRWGKNGLSVSCKTEEIEIEITKTLRIWRWQDLPESKGGKTTRSRDWDPGEGKQVGGNPDGQEVACAKCLLDTCLLLNH